MRRFMVVGRKKSVWFLLGAVVYVFIILLGLGNMVVSLVSITEKELPIYSVQREEALVALTFNCAWEENDIPQLLDLLERENIKATFFLVGQWIERYPDSVRQIVDAGHEIGNHSYSHVDFVGAGEEVIRQQMEKTDALIREVTGSDPVLARVPSGSYDSRVIRLLRQEGYEVIQWDVDSIDWKKPPAKEITERILTKVQNGSIVLFHSGAATTLEALPDVIAGLREKGYCFTTVGDLLLKGETVMDHTGRQMPAKQE
ncbi:MAG: polysaccharide deacetylase family protein [Oscillospiraceae bacterium]